MKLTKREKFVLAAMKSLIKNPTVILGEMQSGTYLKLTPANIARYSVDIADKILKELES